MCWFSAHLNRFIKVSSRCISLHFFSCIVCHLLKLVLCRSFQLYWNDCYSSNDPLRLCLLFRATPQHTNDVRNYDNFQHPSVKKGELGLSSPSFNPILVTSLYISPNERKGKKRDFNKTTLTVRNFNFAILEKILLNLNHKRNQATWWTYEIKILFWSETFWRSISNINYDCLADSTTTTAPLRNRIPHYCHLSHGWLRKNIYKVVFD